MANDRDNDTGQITRSRRTLTRIAEALGRPRSAFYDTSSEAAELAGLTELVRLWQGLRSEADRDKVLALARALAAADGIRDQAAE